MLHHPSFFLCIHSFLMITQNISTIVSLFLSFLFLFASIIIVVVVVTMDRSSCVIYQYPEKMMHTKLKCYKTYASPINAYKENQEKKKKRKKRCRHKLNHVSYVDVDGRQGNHQNSYVCVCVYFMHIYTDVMEWMCGYDRSTLHA